MNKISSAWLYVVGTHLTALLFMFILRICLYVFNLHFLDNVEIENGWISQAFLRGLWFDNIIASYISVLPLVILTVYACFGKIKIPTKVANIYYTTLYTLVFAIGCADIPYFNYFFTHLNASIFNWKEEGDVALSMMFQEPFYLFCFILFLVFSVSFWFIINRIRKCLLNKETKPLQKSQLKYYVPFFLFLLFCSYAGVRGRVGGKPIRPSKAYFCTNSFVNQLGITPSYSLLRSIYDAQKKSKQIDVNLSDKEMADIMQNLLHITAPQEGQSPLYRRVDFDTLSLNKNIVFIFMESMSHNYLDLKVDDRELTPFLNQLKHHALYFSNFYSAAVHTNQGVFASLYSVPVIFDQNVMKNVDVVLAEGLPVNLSKADYNTLFFMPHSSEYDNMNAFLLENGFKNIHAQENYPPAKVVNSYGVADDFLFEYALQEIDKCASSVQPFFATILTVSNHPPFVVPEKYKSMKTSSEFQSVAFADDAIAWFMQESEKKSWFDNTIFVFVGDHGRIIGTPIYDLPLSHNHVPFIIYSKEIAENPQNLEVVGGQIDIFPTIMGLLKIPYVNNGFGVDLLNSDREFLVFNSDNKVGCVNDSLFYNYNYDTQQEFLFKYKTMDTKDYIEEYPDLADSIRTHVQASYKMTNHMIENKLLRSN